MYKPLKCLTWNLEWAESKSVRGKRIQRVIEKENPDVICLTEACIQIVPKEGYLISSQPDYGYPNSGDRRKVILWSKYPWESVDDTGNKNLPGGRFISGITAGIRFTGICIPWKDAHVRTGLKNKKPWKDHLAYLIALDLILKMYREQKEKVCVLGDYNQRIPRKRVPEEVYKKLISVFEPGFHILTRGIPDEEGKLVIDHISISKNLEGKFTGIIPKTLDGKKLTDHTGTKAEIFLSK